MGNQIRLGVHKTQEIASGYIGAWLGAQTAQTAAFTVTGASSDVTLTVPQTWFDRSTPTPVKVRTTVTLPTGLSATALYYAVYINNSLIKLASNLQNALDGVFISPSSAGSGTHTVYRANILDVSGQGNHLLFESGMTDSIATGTANYMSTSAGSSGQCFSLDQATLNARWASPYSSIFVLAFRSKGTLPASTLAILGNSTSASFPGFRLRSTSAGLANPCIDRSTSGLTSFGTSSATAFASGSENSFCMFFDGINGLLDLYINGVVDNSFNGKDISASLTESIAPSATPFYFGGNSTAVTQAWSFRWLHMLVSSVSLNNKDEIANYFHNHGYRPLPAAIWR